MKTIEKLEKAVLKETWGKHLVRSAKRHMRDGVEERDAIDLALKDLEEDLDRQKESIN